MSTIVTTTTRSGTLKGKEKEEDSDEEREQFSGKWAFLMTAIGFTVGLGNIWKFPQKAYKNGGGAFLIPYFIFLFFVGLPLIYLDQVVAQFTQSGPGILYFKYVPAMQGLGFLQIFLAFLQDAYFYTVIGWATIYIVDTLLFQSSQWTRCNNPWNSKFCHSAASDAQCARVNSSFAHFVDGCCRSASIKSYFPNATISVPTEEFFEHYVLQKSPDFGGFGVNWKLLVVMFFLWALAGFILYKGLRFMGHTAFYTTIVPYVIVVLFFILGICLPGSWKGVNYFLFKPDFSKLLDIGTWVDALSQVCITLGVGLGGMQTLGSYVEKDHNCLKDVFIIAFADTFMSLVGGVAVFGTLGYLSGVTGKPIHEVAKAGPSLVFVVYPEAISYLPTRWVWSLLFFIMLFMLGASFVFVSVQHVIRCITDVSEYWRKKKRYLGPIVCAILFVVGSIMCTNAGILYLNTFDQIVSGIPMFISMLLEVIVLVHVYGPLKMRKDIIGVFGEPKSVFQKIFGHGGYYYVFCWTIMCPLSTCVILYFTAIGGLTGLQYGSGNSLFLFPMWTHVLVWVATGLSLAVVPLFVIINTIRLKKETGSYLSAFRMHPTHPSYIKLEDEVTAREAAPEAATTTA